mgnify:CR=1 FL=1
MILAGWLWGANVYIWHNRISHAHIFNLNPATTLSYRQIFKVSHYSNHSQLSLRLTTTFQFMGFLTIVWLFCFVSYLGDTGSHFFLGIPLETWPLGLCTVFLIIFFMPFDFFHRVSRRVLMKVIIDWPPNIIDKLTHYHIYIDVVDSDRISI